jgi:hypothetical protein
MKVEPFTVNRRVVLKAVDNCLGAVVNTITNHFCGRLGKVKVALGAALLSLLVSFPLYKGLSERLDDDVTIQALIVKFHNPLSPIPPELKDQHLYDGDASHNDKLELRLTLPILGWMSGTGKWTVVIWSPLAAMVVFSLLARLGSQALGDDVAGALFVLALAPTFFGAWFFNDYDNGDGIAFMFLLFSIASRNMVFASVSFLAAAFADERCVAAAPLLLLYFAVSLSQVEQQNRRRKLYIAIIFGAGIWWLLRCWVAQSYHLAMGTSLLGTRSLIIGNLTNGFPYVFFDTFRAGWAIPLIAIICLSVRRRWAALLVYVGAFTCALAPALLVVDFGRSVCYAFPVLLASLCFLRGEKEAARKYLAAILVTNILLISPGDSVLKIVTW